VTVTIWHNPNCATSRKVLALIRASGVEPEIVDYVKSPPGVAAIKAILKAMGMQPRDLLRRRGTPHDERGGDKTLSDAALIEAMHAHPILIERPVVQSPKGTRLCRPPERVRDLCDLWTRHGATIVVRGRNVSECRRSSLIKVGSFTPH
jgi:arsenate reductase